MNLIYTILSISCLIFGFYSGYKIGKEQRLPEEIKPSKVIKKHRKRKQDMKEEKEQEEQLKKLQENLDAIDSYDAGL